MHPTPDVLDDYQTFRITSNLIQASHVYKDELGPFLQHLNSTYLKHFIRFDQAELEEVSHGMLYKLKFLDKILELFNDSEKLEIDKIVRAYWDLVLHHNEGIKNIVDCLSTAHKKPFVKILIHKNKRRLLEDRACCVHDLLLLTDHHTLNKRKISLYGVFDGHNGVHAAQFLSLYCPFCLSKAFASLFESEELNINLCAQMVSKTLKDMNNLYLSRYQELVAGSTYNICITCANYLIFINLGDSQSYIINEDGTFINTTPLLHDFSSEVTCGFSALGREKQYNFQWRSCFSFTR